MRDEYDLSQLERVDNVTSLLHRTKRMRAMSENAQTPPAAESKTIKYEDFAKLNLRVGTILEAQPHPDADKLVVMQVDLGTEKRQIVAGIKKFYDPAQLTGKQIIVVTNLEPRTLRGVTSHGMLLAASTEVPGFPGLGLLTTNVTMPPGSQVG